MDDARDQFRLVLKPSRMLAVTLLSAYSGATACMLLLDMGAGIKILMSAFLVLSAYCDLRAHVGAMGHRRVREIVFYSDADWRAVNGVGEALRGRPGGGRLIHPLLVCFTLDHSRGKKLPVLILHDMCNDAAFRQLRTWLRGHAESDRATARSWFQITSRREDGSRL